jgi:hypothetical protein
LPLPRSPTNTAGEVLAVADIHSTHLKCAVALIVGSALSIGGKLIAALGVYVEWVEVYAVGCGAIAGSNARV